MRSDKKPPLKSDKKAPSKVQKKGSLGYNKKSALLEDAITQMNAGKYVRASSALKDLLALDPLNAEARRLFATLHLRLGSLMSARTAFESLAREAMERQDYWLAESLLREYLTAGPRYVPFLEMLGRVYEEKGDVMAAAAEYGKAVEVLLEDPDSEKPNHPSELFARIRSIAPGSPVSFRLAAMFDTVTGQVLQATPQPPIPVPESESSQAAAPEAAPDGVAPMPWEQMEPLQTDGPVAEAPSTSTVAPPTDIIEPVMPPAVPVEAVAAVEPQKPEVDQSPTLETAELQTTPASADPVVPSLPP
ncbi:MAG TPA: tetratricopeptide repeat protein, partial [Nitrospira sp.]|nr:tetratricopeptide repeat protein [Nitrospira sp.]